MNIQKLLYQNIFWRGLFFVSGFVLNILIARHFDAAITGWIFYLFTIFSFFTLIGSFSLEAGLIYFGSKKEISLSSLSSFSILWTLLVAILVSAVYGILILSGNDIPLLKFQYALLFICGNILMTFITGLFYAQQNYFTSNIGAIGMNVILMILLLNVKETSWLNDDIFIFIYFGSFLSLGIFLWIILVRKMSPPIFSTIKKEQLKKLFRYSTLVFTTNAVSFLLYKIDYWFVNRYCDPIELGNYIQISKVAQMFFILPGILAGALFPLIAGNYIEKVENTLKVISRTIFFIYLIGCSFLIIVGKWLFPVVFGESFSGMYQPFLFLIPGILALSTLYTLTVYFSGKNKVSVNLKGSFLALLFIIAGDALLIPKYGIIAAAGVSSFGYIIYHIYVLYTFNRIHHSGVMDFFLFKVSDVKRLKNSIIKNVQVYDKK